MGRLPLILLAILTVSSPLRSQEIKFLYMKQSGYDLADIVAWADSFQKKTGIRVSPVFVEYEDRYHLILESAAKTAPDFDVFLVDLIWIADFAERKIIDPLPPALALKVKDGIVPNIYSAFSYHDLLWAFPFHVDFQMLYTNRDILTRIGHSSPPNTLEEMTRMARKAKEAGIIKYPIFDSWSPQEVLICEFTWMAGAFGGSLTDREGKIDCASPECVRALEFMTELLKLGLINPYSLQSDENFDSEVFLAGDCLFTTNWSFLIRPLQKNEGRDVGSWALSTIPVSESTTQGGTRTSSVCGFEGLGVSSRSRQKQAAWSFVDYLASPDFQSRHLEFMPVWKAVWAQEQAQREDPFLGIKQLQITGLRYRPVHPRYKEISSILQQWIFQALRGQISPGEALRKAQAQIDEVTGRTR